MGNKTEDGLKAGTPAAYPKDMPEYVIKLQQQVQRLEQRCETLEGQIESQLEALAIMTTGQNTPQNTSTASISTLDAGEPTPSLATAPLVATPEAEKRPARPSQVLPLVSVFSGKPGDYRAWRMEMKGKLAADGEAIGTGHAQCTYIYARLGPVAQKMMVAYVERDAHQGNPQNFMDYLDSIYIDERATDLANTRLGKIKQGPCESVADFLPRFETLLQSSAHATSDLSTVYYLTNALNEETTALYDWSTHSYREFKVKLLRIGSLQEQMRLLET